MFCISALKIDSYMALQAAEVHVGVLVAVSLVLVVVSVSSASGDCNWIACTATEVTAVTMQ